MARRLLADSAIVAVGIMAGNVLSYGFSFALSHQLGSTGYGQIGALLALFLIASIPATALQAVTARRVATATAADGGQPGDQVAALAGPLIRWSVLVGLAEAIVLLVLSPALSAALPAVSTAQVAWTAVSLLPYTVISGYFGLAQGTCRFTVFTSLFIAMNAVKFLSGLGVGGVTDNPTVVMAAVAGSWFAVCALCHYALRDLIATRRLVRGNGYLRELGKASWGMGAALMLSLLDGLLSAHYYRGSTLGSYQAGALFTRAGYFGPQFVAILVYPRLAVPETRRTALRAGVAASVAIGLLTTGLVALIAGPLVRVAFGSHYTQGASFSVESAAWLFALAGAVQALVQLVQLDAVARGSAAVGWLVLGGIAAELVAITTFAHHSPDELITTAAIVGSVTAAAGLAMAARARHPATQPMPAAERAPAAA